MAKIRLSPFWIPRLGLTVGVAIRRGHSDADGGTDLLSGDRLLEARHDSVKRELGGGAAFVGAVEHFAVTSVDAHVTDRDSRSRRNDRSVSGTQRVYRSLSNAEGLRDGDQRRGLICRARHRDAAGCSAQRPVRCSAVARRSGGSTAVCGRGRGRGR